MSKTINDERFTEILFTQDQIEKRIIELSTWVDEMYTTSKDLILVGLLKGSIPFLAQLIKSIKTEHTLDFMTVSSYRGEVENTGNIKIIMDLVIDIKDKDVLIVEDIIDSGKSLKKIYENLILRGPKSLRIITLLDKPVNRKTDIQADISGFIVPDKFLVGFGLDVKEKMRNVPFIAVFNKDYLEKL
ncbi:MAG: hypoxanthine phosphoribosyltransferase [Mycoplasmataceae bacterium]|nr:hypoxanthine phosphoribosyltransferase [Mycoplasmataceae bacterium]